MYQRILIGWMCFCFSPYALAFTVERLAVLLKYSSPNRILNQALIQQGEIKSPANSLQWLIKFQVLDQHYCLLYRVPFPKQEIVGELMLHKSMSPEVCPTSMSLQQPSIEAQNLKLNYLPAQSISIEFTNKKQQKQSISINFYDQSSSRMLFNPPEQKAITIADGEMCLEFDAQCNVKIDRCRMCRNGYSIVAGGECSRTYNRRCGIERNDDYAHLRGKSYSHNLPIVLGCHMNSIEGFCSDQKHLVCFDGVLRCQ